MARSWASGLLSRNAKGKQDNDAVIFGGNWDNTSNSGSRSSNWNNSPTNSNNNIGARGVCDDKVLSARWLLRHHRLTLLYVVSLFVLLREIRYWVRNFAWYLMPQAEGNGKADILMKRHKRLIERITTQENLRTAFWRTAKAKRMTFGYLEFKEFAELNLTRLREEMLDGAYTIGKYREFVIYEPKPRLISALDFKDRLVQHAICNVIGPIFERTLLHNTFACRPNMGTHAGVRYVQAATRRPGITHYLKTDYSKFFPSVNREILHRQIERKIGCDKTLHILREIIPQEGNGIPIGSLTSQLFANVYGGLIDRYVHDQLGHRLWARYMDDIVILGSDPVALRDDFYRIQEFSADQMDMRISKWSCSGIGRGINFLGYRIWPTHKLLRPDSVLRAKRKVARYVRHGDAARLNQFIASWSGHASWADTHNLFKWMEKHHGITCN